MDLNLLGEADSVFMKESEREEKHSQAELDSIYLSSKNLMDYSMLIGIKYSDGNLMDINYSPSTIQSKQNISISIIDYLQDYNLEKKFERLLKCFRRDISCVPPSQY